MKPSEETTVGLWQQLSECHRHLASVLEDVQALASAQSFVTAAKRFGEFRLQEERHLRAEDELLEILEETTDCPFERIRAQHAKIAHVMDELTALLSSWNWPALPEALKTLIDLLAAHEADERQSVLPKAETALKGVPAYQMLLWRVGHP